MVIVFRPVIPVPVVPVHLHPAAHRHQSSCACLYCHRFVIHQQENYAKAYRNSMSKKFWWTPPPVNHLKLNTDGSSRGNPGPSSFGGLIRDSKGQWLCGYMGKMKGRSFTSLEAEMWSIFQGLCVIKLKKLSNLVIETDCQAAIMLGVGEVDKDHPLKSVIEGIRTLMIAHKCYMIHTRRDGNHCADQLAKLGGTQSGECILLEKPPVMLIPYLSRDIEAALRSKKDCPDSLARIEA